MIASPWPACCGEDESSSWLEVFVSDCSGLGITEDRSDSPEQDVAQPAGERGLSFGLLAEQPGSHRGVHSRPVNSSHRYWSVHLEFSEMR